MTDRSKQPLREKVCIVGAGPIGLACGIELKKYGMEALLIDKGAPLENLRNWPIGMRFFSSSDKVSLAGVPFITEELRPTREEALRYYIALAGHFNLNIRPNTKLESIETGRKEILLQCNNGSFLAEKLILATGYYDHPRHLGVPGEELPHVSHYLHDPFRYARSRVTIVGGSHSAVDAALMLHRTGAYVRIVHRRPEFYEKLKYWIRPDLENRIKEGAIQAHMNSVIEKIEKEKVVIRNVIDQSRMEVESDFVFLMVGYEPDLSLMRKAGIKVDSQTLVPEFNAETLESNVPGIYLAGSLLGGRQLNKIFIENGREHAAIIARAIAGSNVKN